MRILIADKFPEKQLRRLERLGHDVLVDPRLADGSLAAAVRDHNVLVVRSTKVTADILDAAGHLGLVVRAGAGVNTIDTGAAAERGIFVCNTPGKNSIAVAELAVGLMLAIDRAIPDNVRDLRGGVWDKQRYSKADGIAGKRLGILGLGAIGIEVARRARAFRMRVIVIDRPDRDPDAVEAIEELQLRTVPDLETLVEESDILSVHLPATKGTRGMIGRDLLDRMKPGAVLINTSRGELLDEDAVLEAIDQKGLRIGLDVYADEPAGSVGEFGSRLGRHPAVYGTHHIGASTEQAERATAEAVIEVIENFARGELVNCVNIEADARGHTTLFVRHHNRVGVLARILHELRRANLNVERMDNRIFQGAVAGSATIHVGGVPETSTIDAIRAIDDVIAVRVADSAP